MNIILVILSVIAIIVAFALFLALIVKNNYVVERDMVINKPKEEVFNYLKMVKNQEAYSVWVMMDPNVKLDYKGIDGALGFIGAWEGNKQAGKGEQEITKIDEGNSITIEVRFEKPFKSIAQTYLQTTSLTTNQTKVTWKMSGHANYPMNLMNMMMEGLLGKDMLKSLDNVKRILE